LTLSIRMAKAMDSSKNILAGLLILSFLLLVLVATNWMQKPMNSVNSVKEGDTTKEGFRVAPTRAAECKCLPGYVPSKETSAKAGKIYTDSIRTFWYFFVPNGTNKVYRINEHNPCGIKHIYTDANLANQNLGKYPTLPRTGGFIHSGYLSCDMLNADTKNDSSRYKCQNLEDPSNTKECY